MKYLLALLATGATAAALPISLNCADSLLQAGYQETIIADQGIALEPAAAEQSRGFVIYARDRNYEVFPHSRPAQDERLDTLRLRATPGETESKGFCLYALTYLVQATVSCTLSIATKRSQWLATAAKVQEVIFHPIHSMVRNDTGKKFIRYPVFLSAPAPHAVQAGATNLFWVTIKVPEKQPAGTYQGAIMAMVNGKKHPVPFSIQVLPFTLTKTNLPRFGAFLSADTFASQEHAFLKESGLDALMWFWRAYRIQVLNENGSLKLDFTAADAFISAMKQAGMQGPVVIGLGNESYGSYENAISRAFHLPLVEMELNGAKISVADTTNDAFNKLYVEGVGLLWQHAQEKQWPGFALMIYDEAMKRLLPWQIHWYNLIKKAVPDIPIYGVFQIADADKMAQVPACDIMVCNRGFADTKALALANNKRFWTYHNCDANRSFGKVRFSIGQIPSYYGSEVMFFWSYNYYLGNPWDDFDTNQGDADWVIAYPSVDGQRPVETLAWKGLIEGIDDVRYLKTLEQTLAKQAPGRMDRVLSRVRAMQNKMFEGIVLDHRIYTDGDFFRTARNDDTERIRNFVIEELLKYPAQP